MLHVRLRSLLPTLSPPKRLMRSRLPVATTWMISTSRPGHAEERRNAKGAPRSRTHARTTTWATETAPTCAPPRARRWPRTSRSRCPSTAAAGPLCRTRAAQRGPAGAMACDRTNDDRGGRPSARPRRSRDQIPASAASSSALRWRPPRRLDSEGRGEHHGSPPPVVRECVAARRSAAMAHILLIRVWSNGEALATARRAARCRSRVVVGEAG